MRSHLAKQLDIVEVEKPVGVVDDQGFAVGEVDEACHLLLEALDVVRDLFLGEHFPHVGLARGVADHSGAAAQESDGLVARHLQTLHQAQSHKMPYVKAVRRGVEADVEGCLAFVDKVAHGLLVGDLCDEAAGLQFFIDFHCFVLLKLIRARLCPVEKDEGALVLPPFFVAGSHP